MTKVLAKDNEFLLDAILVIFEDLDIVNSLLKFLIIFLLKGIDIEDKKVAIVASDPGEIIVHAAAEKSMPTRLFHNDCAKVLVVHVELVALASREDQSRIIGRP